jgi:hypothetical protein
LHILFNSHTKYIKPNYLLGGTNNLKPPNTDILGEPSMINDQ